jgi:dTDP-4-amino-4,6-dideoxygalactose transaminase
LYVIQLEDGISVENHAQLFSSMREAGVGVNLHYIPVHTQPYFKQLGFRKGDFPNAEHFYWRALTLPLYPNLSAENQEKVIDSLLCATKA